MNAKRLTSNLKLKLMALGLAVLSWYIVSTITNFDKVITNVNMVLLLPEGWAVLEKSTDDFQVTFRGTKEDLLMLDERSVQLFLDLRNEEFTPTKRIRLTNRMVTHNSKARIYDLHPANLDLRLGREGQRRLPIRPATTGEPADGMRLETISFEPTHVTLYGAEDRLDTVTSLQSAPLLLTDRSRSFEQRVDVQLPSPDWIGRVEPARVLVRVNLSGLTEDRIFENIPVRLSFLSDQQQGRNRIPEPENVRVTLKGRPELLAELDASVIQAFAPYIEGQTEAQVIVHVPAGLDVLDISPSEVRLRTPPEPPPEPPPEETGAGAEPDTAP